MTITILSIAHMGILEFSSLYGNIQLLIGPFPWYLSLDIIDKCSVVNSVLLPSIALNCLPGCCTKMFNCSGILD
jgi:hypothetical protein